MREQRQQGRSSRFPRGRGRSYGESSRSYLDQDKPNQDNTKS